MSIIRPEIVTCGVCGKNMEVLMLYSTNAIGSMDLDTRPPQMQRNTMNCWVHRCNCCGYVSEHIENVPEYLREIKGLLESKEYKQTDEFQFDSLLAKRFYNLYQIAKITNNLDAIFYALKCCAWSCDDNANDKENAKNIRLLAIPYLEKIIEKETDNDIIENKTITLAEYYRRTEQYDKVLYILKNNEKFKQDIVRDIAQFQIKCAMKEDSMNYTVKEAIDEIRKEIDKAES